ncbi:MAG: type II toxin-antitoxin system RelE/ParE family toxin [Mariniphaga sp.]|jgi:toxin ParE1/3/4
MAKYRLTNRAVADLTQIWNYTFDKWSENQADRYFEMLIDNFDELAMDPNLGKDYYMVTVNLLGFKAGRHIIFYHRIDNNEIEIVRILHEQMDLKSRITNK